MGSHIVYKVLMHLHLTLQHFVDGPIMVNNDRNVYLYQEKRKVFVFGGVLMICFWMIYSHKGMYYFKLILLINRILMKV